MSEELARKLLDVLALEERVHRDLRELLAEERGRMIALDADALYGLAARKEVLAEEGRLAERGRVALVNQCAQGLGIGELPISLGRLCDALGEAASAPLREAQSRLVAVIGAVRELAEANRVLGGERLAHVQSTLTLLGRLSPSLPSDGAAQAGSLVRTSA